MLHFNLEDAFPFVDKALLEKCRDNSRKSYTNLLNHSGKGNEWLGWQTLLENPNDALISSIQQLADKIRTHADYFIVCGIGGSYLGAKAVIDALVPETSKPEVLYMGHNLSGSHLNRVVKKISQKKPDGTQPQVYMNVISKSGTTIEPALSFRILRNWFERVYDNASERIICTTSESGGALNKVIEANGYRKFVIPDDVGGRFSVMTAVGLLPIAVAGVDIRSMYYGAVAQYNEIKNKEESVIHYTSLREALYKSSYSIDIIATFEPELNSIGSWLQQLFGESEGKEGNGLYPAVHSYSTDLHSLGQMVQDGKRNIIETFLNVKKSIADVSIPVDSDNFDGLNYVSGLTMHQINEKARLGTRSAHINGGVPVLDISMNYLDAEHLGALIYFFEISTGIYCYNLNINPFDQPGVEGYKKAMYKLLGKPEL